jgi:hypothetical protein
MRSLPNYTLEELFRGKSAEEWRRLFACAFDWGPDVGREIVPDENSEAGVGDAPHRTPG